MIWASEVRLPLINPNWDGERIPLSRANCSRRLFSMDKKSFPRQESKDTPR